MTDDARSKAEEAAEDPAPLAPRSARGCRIEFAEGTRRLDLSAGETHLLGHGHPAVDAAVREALSSGLSERHSAGLGREVAQLLRAAFPEAERVWLCEGHADALQAAFRHARGDRRSANLVIYCSERGTMRGGWTRISSGSFEIRPHFFNESMDRLLEELLDERAADIAAIAMVQLSPSKRDRVLAIVERARARDISVLFDETETAFRDAKGGVQHELGIGPDLTVVGGGLAGGLSFGAVLGSGDRIQNSYDGQPLTLAAARATLEVLAAEPVHERLVAIGERWRTAFAAACAEHDVHARLRGPATHMEVVFDGQENAGSQLMHGVFLDELRKSGAIAHGYLYPCAAMTDGDVAEAEDVLRRTVARLRTLLIEHNSYLSGGLAWAFPGADTPLAARGLAIYRFPAAAEVDVVTEDGIARISFLPGDLGEVTSSGFYVPTRVRGDFTATASYHLTQWRPGAESASFALFAQNEASTLRYYAQRRSAGDGAPELLANFNNVDLSEPRPVTEPSGALRVQRRGDVVSCWHRGDGEWVQLGEHRGDPTDDVILGSKIWSSGTAGALEAELTDLRVDGEIPEPQLDPVPIRPDPRHEPL